MPNELSNVGRAYRAAMGMPESVAYLSVSDGLSDPAHRLLRSVTPGSHDGYEVNYGHVRAARIVPYADRADATELGARFRPERVTHWAPHDGLSRRFTIRVPGGVGDIPAQLYMHDIPHAVLVPTHGAVDIHIFSQSPKADAGVVKSLAEKLNGRVKISRGTTEVLTGIDSYK